LRPCRLPFTGWSAARLALHSIVGFGLRTPLLNILSAIAIAQFPRRLIQSSANFAQRSTFQALAPAFATDASAVRLILSPPRRSRVTAMLRIGSGLLARRAGQFSLPHSGLGGQCPHPPGGFSWRYPIPHGMSDAPHLLCSRTDRRAGRKLAFDATGVCFKVLYSIQ